jgi:hypothetical protein
MDHSPGSSGRNDQRSANRVPSDCQRRVQESRQEFPAFWEAALGGLLASGALVLLVTNRDQIREICFLAAVLCVQSLPFLSARDRVARRRGTKSFSYSWRVEIRISERFRVTP